MIADPAVQKLCYRQNYLIPSDTDDWTVLDFVLARLASYVLGAQASLQDVQRNQHDLQLASEKYMAYLLAFEAAVSEAIRNADRIHKRRE